MFKERRGKSEEREVLPDFIVVGKTPGLFYYGNNLLLVSFCLRIPGGSW